MTFTKTLKRIDVNGKSIIASEHIDKYSNIARYDVIIADESGFVHPCDVYKCSKSTWRKKFAELVNAYYYRIAESLFDCGCDSCECEQVAHDIKCGLDTVEHWVNRAIAYYAVLGNDASDINSTVRRYVADIAKRHV